MGTLKRNSQHNRTTDTTRITSHISTEGLNLHALEQVILPYALRDQHEEIIRLLQHAPPEVIAHSSSLGYWLALALLSSSRMSEGSRVLRLLEQYHPLPNDLTAGRILLVRAVESIFGGGSDQALEFAQEATAILPNSALQERFRAWATIEVLSIHFGYYGGSWHRSGCRNFGVNSRQISTGGIPLWFQTGQIGSSNLGEWTKPRRFFRIS